MLYLLDANTLITAHNTYYAVNRVPEFWTWLAHHGAHGRIKMPIETFEEVKGETGNADKDKLFAHVQDRAFRDAIVLKEDVDIATVQDVLSKGYAADLDDAEIERIGRDPFLIAYVLAAGDRCVVSGEVSRPKAQRANRRVPDVCATLGARCCNIVTLIRELDFTTGWDS
ncbi:DUF4411 family protein [Methylobacterium sp. NEAU 140]|uniref:DUF4411 family protein n=1 Tax=Methylobacterium sp. NEAU 140 TaxID=3064945 RepID=UPI0027342352|nr:DUF4411 family protein [Methylobacterium sp. NEAU 140]MDP4022867.1 DUF4411 family protein [Methylobacterium sp. NEAU 140]